MKILLAEDDEHLGLGLSLAKAIVTEHKGKIWIEDNKTGNGSVFNISLPLKNS